MKFSANIYINLLFNVSEIVPVSSCLFLKWFFLQKASGTRFRRDVITGFSLMRKNCTPRYSKTVAFESGCGWASCWNKTESSTIAALVPGFPWRKVRHEQETFFCHAPEIPLPHHIKSGNKNCRTCLWGKRAIGIHPCSSFLHKNLQCKTWHMF